MNRLLRTAAALGALAAFSLPAAAQFQKPEDAVKYRQAAFTVLGSHFGRIGAMVNNRVPFDATQMQANAELVSVLAKLPYTAFGEGTGVGNTKAKAEIWTERVKFDAAATKMQEETAKLAAAAKTGNMDQIKVAFGSAGQSCKGCHDAYRKE